MRQSFPACDGTRLPRGHAQCVFTEQSADRLGRKQNVNRCIRHGNIICDWIEADSVEAARKKAKQWATKAAE